MGLQGSTVMQTCDTMTKGTAEVPIYGCFLLWYTMGNMSKGDKKKGYIYALTLDNVVMYVGQTYDLNKRYAQHCSLAQNISKKTKRCQWLSEVILDGRKPDIEILERTYDLDVAEIKWIKRYRRTNPNLLNTADGGKTMTYLHRAKQTKPWGKGHSPVQKILMSFRQDERMFRRLGNEKQAEKSRQRYIQSLELIEKVGRDIMNEKLWERQMEKKNARQSA